MLSGRLLLSVVGEIKKNYVSARSAEIFRSEEKTIKGKNIWPARSAGQMFWQGFPLWLLLGHALFSRAGKKRMSLEGGFWYIYAWKILNIFCHTLEDFLRKIAEKKSPSWKISKSLGGDFSPVDHTSFSSILRSPVFLDRIPIFGLKINRSRSRSRSANRSRKLQWQTHKWDFWQFFNFTKIVYSKSFNKKIQIFLVGIPLINFVCWQFIYL